MRNEIRHNKVGVEVVSAEPLIFENVIDYNHTFGVFTRNFYDSVKNKITLLKKNLIFPLIYIIMCNIIKEKKCCSKM
jgi:hypothetical protein